jgi:hypothetical protein
LPSSFFTKKTLLFNPIATCYLLATYGSINSLRQPIAPGLLREFRAGMQQHTELPQQIRSF